MTISYDKHFYRDKHKILRLLRGWMLNLEEYWAMKEG